VLELITLFQYVGAVHECACKVGRVAAIDQEREGMAPPPHAPVSQPDRGDAPEPGDAVSEQDEEQLRVSTTNLVMQHAAEWYVRFLYPTPYERVFYLPGKRVLVSVREYVTADDTIPVFGVSE
jgi:hypothetical protein